MLRNAWENKAPLTFSTDADYFVPGKTRGEVAIEFIETWKAAGIPARDILHKGQSWRLQRGDRARRLLLTFGRRRPIPTDARHERHSVPPRMPRESSADVLQGTLDLLVLKTLALRPMHGWGIAQRIQEMSRDALDVGQGSVYPALLRLEDRGLVASEWGVTENNRRARYYRLTALGHRQLKAETESWRRYARAVELILRTT